MLPASYYVKQIDPKMDLTAPVKIILEEGAEYYTPQFYDAVGQSASNIQFQNINPPSPDVIVDRKVFLRVGLRLTFTGNNAAGNLLSVGTTDAPRS